MKINSVEHSNSRQALSQLLLLTLFSSWYFLPGVIAVEALTDPCAPINLSPQTWADLDIDNYIANYPNANQLTVQQWAAELEMANFFCDIGRDCQAGQLCHPARGINWIIFYAIQEWNNYMNGFYNAIEDVIALMKDATADIVSDFIPRREFQHGLYGWALSTIVIGAVAGCTAVAVPLLLPADAIAMVTEATKVGVGAGLAGALGVPESGYAVKSIDTAEEYRKAAGFLQAADSKQASDIQAEHDIDTLQKARYATKDGTSSSTKPTTPSNGPSAPPPPPAPPAPPVNLKKRSLVPEGGKRNRPSSPYAFDRWVYMDTHLTVLQNRMQTYVAMTVKLAMTTPILAENGIASILKGGSFLYPNPTQFYLNSQIKALAQITALSEFFKSIKVFATIGSDECKYKGPNGAWDHPEKLSYCTPEGLMMNIIRAQGDKAVNRFPNKDLLEKKYGYPTKWLVEKALDCQKKWGVYTESKAPPPSSMDSDCIFSIAVCDCTAPNITRLRHKGKKMTTVRACRIGANLPI